LCPPLPAPKGETVTVAPSQAGKLGSIINNAKPGTTIFLEDGLYRVPYIYLTRSGVTIRSKSGNRDAVILDREYRDGSAIAIAASDVTLADMTLRHARHHPVHVVKGGARVRLYNLHILDGSQQQVKVSGGRNDHGELACSLIEITNEGRPHVQSGCYTGGIDAHETTGWVVRDNVFRDIYCQSGLAEHAVHFWSGCKDTLVERNLIVNSARGIGFGLGGRGHVGGVIVNNVIHVDDEHERYYDTGIGLESASGAKVFHNTVMGKPGFSSMDCRFQDTSAEIVNNIFHNITKRDGAKAVLDNNLTNPDLSYFADPSAADYHLTPEATEAIDSGSTDLGVKYDMDQIKRDGNPDIGAYELGE
jgi:hypothetical protein